MRTPLFLARIFPGFLALLLLNSCAGFPGASAKPLSYDEDLFLPITFLEHADAAPMKSYLAMNVPFPPVERLRQQVEHRLGFQLKHRGEAHITVITPVEYDQILSKRIDIRKIHEIARQMKIQEMDFEPVCVGRALANLEGRGEQTYYVIVRSPQLLDLRRAVRDAAGGDDFRPENWHPHITLGFTKRDLHESDGAVKNERTCWAPLRADERP